MNTDYTKALEKILEKEFSPFAGTEDACERAFHSLQALLVRAEKSGRVDELRVLLSSRPDVDVSDLAPEEAFQLCHNAYKDLIFTRLATLQGGKCKTCKGEGSLRKELIPCPDCHGWGHHNRPATGLEGGKE